MDFIVPYIDVSNLDSNAFCYSFYNDNIIAYFSNGSSKKYKLVNNKIYRADSDDIVLYDSDVCYSYLDIAHIPHSSAGLAPFYCFLAVVIFLTLLYVPYKIFIRPFFRKL